MVGEFEWSVIRVSDASADPAAPAVEWLEQNGYDVTPEGANLIGPYLADGMNLLALKLVRGRGRVRLRPLAAPIMLWGYLQYRSVGRYRVEHGGGGPGL